MLSVLISKGLIGYFYIYEVSDVRRGNIVHAFKVSSAIVLSLQIRRVGKLTLHKSSS